METVRKNLHKQIRFIEYSLAVMLAMALLVIGWYMAKDIYRFSLGNPIAETFHQLLAHAFLLFIGIEFIKVVVSPNPENIMEVVMVTITRAIIMDHSSMLTTLCGVAALAVVFGIRRYLLHIKES
ncbi:uncharacterized membrane protein (DUF373 family) [Lachnospiraceae bacterium PM6-15]|uniref:hypothetical protein n=1 Tax=Ohessyouella blattaphilus TaxID=2949333 RepID=UPI003E22395C